MTLQDCYRILGIPREASPEEIKKAYRTLASQHHPDKNKDPGALAKMQQINEAYTMLTDPKNSEPLGKTEWSKRMQEEDFSEMFKTFFDAKNKFKFDEDLFGQKVKENPFQSSLNVITISLADAYTGKMVKVGNNININVPSGIRSGTKLYVNGNVFRVDVLSDSKFKRANDDLLVDVEITAQEAMVGITAFLACPDDTKLQFSIPAGMQNGNVVKLSNRGMKNPETDKRGDILVRISVSIPKSLTEEQKEVIKKVLPVRPEVNI